MSGRSLMRWVLLAFVIVSLGYLGVTEFKKQEPLETTSGVAPIPEPPQSLATIDVPDRGHKVARTHKVIAYYFHNTQRCKTCLQIERWSREALRTQFGDRFDAGEIEWRSLNMEEAPNEHFVRDYDLVTSSLVFVNLIDGQQRDWVNMKDVWELVHSDEHEFKEYVATQARRYLESES